MSGSGHSSRKVKINSKYANPDIRADIWGPKTDIKMSGCGHCECPDLLGTYLCYVHICICFMMKLMDIDET